MSVEEKQAKFLKCLGEATRLQILKLLTNGERCVGELAEALNKEQSLISHHLKALKECNIVKERPEAQKVYYSLRDDRLARLISEVETLIKELLLCQEGGKIDKRETN